MDQLGTCMELSKKKKIIFSLAFYVEFGKASDIILDYMQNLVGDIYDFSNITCTPCKM